MFESHKGLDSVLLPSHGTCKASMKSSRSSSTILGNVCWPAVKCGAVGFVSPLLSVTTSAPRKLSVWPVWTYVVAVPAGRLIAATTGFVVIFVPIDRGTVLRRALAN